MANYFSRFQQSHGIAALTGARLLVSATGRHRIPDVLVLKTPFQDERVVTEIPLAIVEIQSPDDTLSDIMDRCIDYENRGVRLILILDPVKRRSWMFQSGGLQTLGDSLRVDLAGKAADLSFAEMFAELASSFDRAPG